MKLYAVNKLNDRGKASSISSFVFPTLYTRITHDILLKIFNKLKAFFLNVFFRGIKREHRGEKD